MNAHNSSKYKIIEKLFPDINSDLKSFFDDKLLNDTKEIIRGMKNYFVQGQKDSEFKTRMEAAIKSIKSNLKYLNNK